MADETKTEKFCCKSCIEELKNIPVSFDAFSFLSPVVQRYCNNKECSRYGDVTVAFILKEVPKTDL